MSYLDIQAVEQRLREKLLATREEKPRNYRVSSLILYEELKRFFPLTAGTFTKLIGDMKRIGVVGTTKNAEVFLSDSAWELTRCCDTSGGLVICELRKGHAGLHRDGNEEWGGGAN